MASSEIKQIHERIDGNDFKIALKMCTQSLEEAERQEDKKKAEELRLIQNDVQAKIVKNKIKSCMERARIEKEYDQRYAQAIDYLQEAKRHLDTLFKLGKEHKKIPAKRKEINRRISELEDLVEKKGEKHEEGSADPVVSDSDTAADTNESETTAKTEKKKRERPKENAPQVTESPSPTHPRLEKPRVPQRLERRSPPCRPKNAAQKTEHDKKVGPPQRMSRPPTNSLRRDGQSKPGPLAPEKTAHKADSHPRPSQIKIEQDSFSRERVHNKKIEQMKKYLSALFEERGYFIMKQAHLPALFSSYERDIAVAVKILDIDPYRSIIHLVPVKICDLKGSLIVEKDKILYKSFEGNTLLGAAEKEKNILIGANLTRIKEVYAKLFSTTYEEGKIFEFFRAFLKRKISIERTKILHKELYLRDGPVEYKLHITPVLTTFEQVGNTEINTPFPLYKNNIDLHIVQYELLEDLLGYLTHKLRFLLYYTSEDNSIERLLKMKYALTKGLKQISYPFLGIGMILTLCIVTGVLSSPISITMLGAGLISVYSVLSALVYIRFLLQKRELSRTFLKETVHIPRQDLFTIAEKFIEAGHEEYFYQFQYELFEKEMDADILSMLAKDRTRSTEPESEPEPVRPLYNEAGPSESNPSESNSNKFRARLRSPEDGSEESDIYSEFGEFLEEN